MKQNVRLLTTAKIEVQKFRNGIQTDEIANLTSRNDGLVVALAGTPAGQCLNVATNGYYIFRLPAFLLS